MQSHPNTNHISPLPAASKDSSLRPFVLCCFNFSPKALFYTVSVTDLVFSIPLFFTASVLGAVFQTAMFILSIVGIVMFARSNNLTGTFVGCYIKMRTVMVGIFTLISIALTYIFLYILMKESNHLDSHEEDMVVLHMFVHFFLVTPYCLMTMQWGVMLWGLNTAKAELDLHSGNEQVSLQKGSFDASHTMDQAL